MNALARVCVLLLAGIALAVADPDPNTGWQSVYSGSGLQYVNVENAAAISSDLSSVVPPVHPEKVPGLTPEGYLASTSCLGYLGPLGPYGPLGQLGPLGDQSWNPETYISAFGDWSAWSKANLEGPMSEQGPLGEKGPVGSAYYSGSVFEENDFAVQTRALGLWAALGPIGPLGALGPLGPLGPVGAHGFEKDNNGNYIDTSSNSVVNNVSVYYDSARTQQRAYPLFELYTSAQAAQQQPVPDASYGVMSSTFSSEKFPVFTDNGDQLVTIVVVPQYQLDVFKVDVYDKSGRTVASSAPAGGDYVPSLQIKVPAFTTLTVEVSLVSHMHLLEPAYRLFVTGSTSYLAQTNIQGNHIHQWYN